MEYKIQKKRKKKTNADLPDVVVTLNVKYEDYEKVIEALKKIEGVEKMQVAW